MDEIVVHTFAAEGEFFEAIHEPDGELNLSTGDVVEAVPNIWPAKVVEVNYVVKKNKKIYSIELESRADNKDFLHKARKSDKWNVTKPH